MLKKQLDLLALRYVIVNWHIYNYILCNLIADKYNKIPIVNFCGSLYLSNTDELGLIHNNKNWFYNYFQDNLDISNSTYNTVINYPNRVNFTTSILGNCSTKTDDYVYYFNYDTFGEFNFLSFGDSMYIDIEKCKI